MAKKKKSALKNSNNARGYSQGIAQPQSFKPTTSSSKTPTTTTTVTSVSSKKHDEIKALLELGNSTATSYNNNNNTAQTTTSSSATNTSSNNFDNNNNDKPSDRFPSRLSKIVTHLQNLKFSDSQIDQVVSSLKYDITLENALDWFCLNLNTLDLPPIFTDLSLRETLRDNNYNNNGDYSGTTLDVLMPKPTSNLGEARGSGNGGNEEENIAREENVLVVRAPKTNEVGGEGEETLVGHKDDNTQSRQQHQNDKEEEEEERKRWLLQQYGYEEEAEEDGDEYDPNNESYNENNNNYYNNNIGNKNTQHPQQLQSPEEIKLAQEETKLQEMEDDLANDANNYMRSKAEIKQLQIQVKKMRQQVAGLRKRVEKMKAKQRQQIMEDAEMEKEIAAEVRESGKAVILGGNGSSAKQQEDEDVECDDEEYGGGFFDMDLFGTSNKDDDEDEDEDDAAAQTNTTATKQLLPECTIPKNWTGTTPQKKLDEICKKQKLPKPKYTKLPLNEGFRLTIIIATTTTTPKKIQSPQEWEAKYLDFSNGGRDSSLKDYLAMKALYSMDPTLQLYSIFPPSFRDLWLSWVKLEKEGKEQVRREESEAKQERLDYLLSLISSAVSQESEEAVGLSKPEDDDAVIHDDDDDGDAYVENETMDWDDSSDDEPVQSKSMTVTNYGKKLQASFVKRQSTPSYQEMKALRDVLPMASFRQTVLDSVKNNPVTILCAETGAGKTTQCPQFLLEQALLDGSGDRVQILCTQPRRVAATSVAERVAEEMCESLGKMVGYQIRMESRRSAETKLLFCTTGVILRRLQDDNTLKGVTHVIVDEVHERQQQTDILLVILRNLLDTTRPDLKVILMSATMDSELFCSFFHGAPMISVPGRTFPVSEYYLEDLLEATGHIIEAGSRHAIRESHRHYEKASLWVTTKGGEKRKEVVDISQAKLENAVSETYIDYNMATRKSMDRVDESVINFDLIEDVLSLLVREDADGILKRPAGTQRLVNGSILVFLPGLGEIKSLTERLEGSRMFGDKQRFLVVPMHSTLSSQDQRRAFIPGKKGCRKIILATNIAETSVTIPDVTCVIDSGRMREVRRNKRTSTSILAIDWCSKASAKQRAGRAGRVQSGIALKLYSSQTARHVMKASSEPELRRVPLEEVCLSILASGFAQSCMDFLIQAPQPPEEASVRAAVQTLYDVGAIESPTATSGARMQSEKLTPLGVHLAKLPVDVRLGKMLIFGALFHCVDPIVTIAASLSSQSPFSTFVSDEAVAKAKQRAFTDPNSDFRTYCNVWDAYNNVATNSASAGRKFCRDNYLNYIAMREIGDARRQFLDLLSCIGFLRHDKSSKVFDRKSPPNKYSNKEDLVHAIICAGLYPNVARVDQSGHNNGYALWHKDERLYFRNSSVHASKKRFTSSESWVVFHEKFGTSNRTSISTACFVHPVVFMLFGGSVVIKHLERLVIVDDWMTIEMAAQTGVILREFRNQVDHLLKKMVEHADASKMTKSDCAMIEGIVKILVS